MKIRKKLGSLYTRSLIYLYRTNERLLEKIFFSQPYNNFVEIGVHQGEVFSKIDENARYYGVEANIFNIKEYSLKENNVINFACVPSEYKKTHIEFNIPVRTQNDMSRENIVSGKGSVLERNTKGWFSIEKLIVPTITPAKIMSEMDDKTAIWIDAEGISRSLMHEFSNFDHAFCIHFEYDIERNEKPKTVMNIYKNNFNFILMSRINHDQYNVLMIRNYVKRRRVRWIVALITLNNFIIESSLYTINLLSKLRLI